MASQLKGPKKPWLDWKRDEPVPEHLRSPSPKLKKVSSAYLAFFFFNGLGGHRIYVDDGRGAIVWFLKALGLQLVFVPCYFAEASGVPWSVNIKLYLVAASLFVVFIIYREFCTIRPSVEAFNRKHHD